MSWFSFPVVKELNASLQANREAVFSVVNLSFETIREKRDPPEKRKLIALFDRHLHACRSRDRVLLIFPLAVANLGCAVVLVTRHAEITGALQKCVEYLASTTRGTEV